MKTNKNLESELKIQSSYQLQAKIDLDSSSGNYEVLKTKIFTDLDLQLEYVGTRPTIDEYWDTPDFMMHKNGSSFRVRHLNSQTSLEIKEAADILDESSLFNRNEFSTNLTLVELHDALASKFMDIRRIHCPYTVGSEFEFKLRVQNARKVWRVHKGDAELELVLDLFTYSTPNSNSSTLFNEIEIEAKNDQGRITLLEIARRIDTSKELIRSGNSKYSRGVEALNLNKNDWLHKFSHWHNTPQGKHFSIIANYAGLIIGVIIGIISVIVSIILSW